MFERFRIAFAAFRFVWNIYPRAFMIEVSREDGACGLGQSTRQQKNFTVVPDDFEASALVDYSEFRNITKH